MTILKANGINIDDFGGGGKQGWNFNWCYPQMHRDLLPLVRPGDSVLDLGSGFGRSAFPFALKGAEITLVEKDKCRLSEARKSFSSAGLKNQACDIDLEVFLSLSREIYKFVILSDTITHVPKSRGIEIISRSIEHCFGYIFISVPSTFSWIYQMYRENGYSSSEPGTFFDFCSCSGIEQLEAFSFYYPGEIESLIVAKKGHIICAESIVNHTDNQNWIVVAGF